VYPCNASPLQEHILDATCNEDDVKTNFEKFHDDRTLKVTGGEDQRRCRKRVLVEAGKSIAHETDDDSFTSLPTSPSIQNCKIKRWEVVS
jgi:hypothetical protein